MYKILPILLFAVGFAVTTEDIYDNSYALIIGISEYQNVSHLNYGASDAEAIHNVLISHFDFPEENTKLLINVDATADNIRRAFSDFMNVIDENDRFLIYFSGHGATESLPNGEERGYLMPVNSDPLNLFSSSIPMEELKRISQITIAKHILYLVDATYGGIAREGNRENVNLDNLDYLYEGKEAATIKIIKNRLQNIYGDYIEPKNLPSYIRKITNDRGRQIITAGGRGEQTIEKPEWGHSAFTKNLISALYDGQADINDDGIIIATELGNYIRSGVAIDTEGIQTPYVRRFTSDMGEFIFMVKENISEEENIGEIVKTEDKVRQIIIAGGGDEIAIKYEITIENMDSIMGIYNNDPMIFKNMDNTQLVKWAELTAEKRKMLSTNTKEVNIRKNKKDIYDNSFAIIIGINEYTKSKPLRYAVKDAKDINKLLVNKFGFKEKNIRLLINNEATLISIKQALYEVAGLAKENDRVLIYFAGHGQTHTTKGGKQIGYLIPVNGDLKVPTLTGIPMDDIIILCESDTRHMLFLMDACYSGLMAEGTRGLNISEDDEYYFSTVTELTSRQIITAGNGEQEVLEGDTWQNSAFTHSLLNALNNWEVDKNNNGFITASQLGAYLIEKVTDDTQGRQTPQVERITQSKSGEFIFFKNP